MSHINKLNEMVEKKKVKSTKNIAAIVIDEKIQIWYLYGAWIINEQGKEAMSGRSRSYEAFIKMVTERYPPEKFGDHKIID